MAREVGRTREASGARRLRLLADQAPRRFRFFFSSSLLPSFVVPFFPRACGAMLPRHTCNSAITVCDGYKWLFPCSIVRPPAMGTKPWGRRKKKKRVSKTCFYCLLQRLGAPTPRLSKALLDWHRFSCCHKVPPRRYTHTHPPPYYQRFLGGGFCAVRLISFFLLTT